MQIQKGSSLSRTPTRPNTSTREGWDLVALSFLTSSDQKTRLFSAPRSRLGSRAKSLPVLATPCASSTTMSSALVVRRPALPNPISWYPGHMTKFTRMLPQYLSRTHVVLEVRDCRMPLTTVNKHFDGTSFSHR